jgi:predicted tellurium resistance membrane protein TerC
MTNTHFNLLPYLAFLIFFVITFLLTTEENIIWFHSKCSSTFWAFVIFALIIASLAFIWTGCIMKYTYSNYII